MVDVNVCMQVILFKMQCRRSIHSTRCFAISSSSSYTYSPSSTSSSSSSASSSSTLLLLLNGMANVKIKRRK